MPNRSCWSLMVVALLGLSLGFEKMGFEQNVFAQRRIPFPAPTVTHDSVRGRVYVRNGLFRNVYRERWGNGIQPAGAMVLTNLFNNVALVGSGYLTGKPVSDGSTEGTKPNSGGDFSSESAEISDEKHQQRMATLTKMEDRANNLLRALKVAVPAETDGVAKPDVASGTTFHPEGAPGKK